MLWGLTTSDMRANYLRISSVELQRKENLQRTVHSIHDYKFGTGLTSFYAMTSHVAIEMFTRTHQRMKRFFAVSFFVCE